MFQLDWARRDRWHQEDDISAVDAARLPVKPVDRVLLLHWDEHCIECAIPTCYSTCPLFVARSDRKCARFVYGIYPNPAFRGLYAFGADVRFRRWAKLETEVHHRLLTLPRNRALHALSAAATAGVNPIASVLTALNPKRRLNGALAVARSRSLRKLGGMPRPVDVDEFVLECFSPNPEAFRLILECRKVDHPFRHAFEVTPGWNHHTLPAAPFHLEGFQRDGRITLYPEDDYEARLIFTWLDFVRYAKAAMPTGDARPPEPAAARSAGDPAAKVKCVAWDLDNTLWRGTLVEETADGLELDQSAVQTIHELDRRGILQTVVSKNNFDEAWVVIQAHGLEEYFLHPQINWGQKSKSLRRIADALNIHANTLALVDDSAFERAEVQAALPDVRVYTEKQIGGLLQLDEFDVPITEAGRTRRLSYKQEISRKEHLSTFTDDYEGFLRSCEMRLQIFRPRDEAHITRCLELIQRTNQLNLSGRRLTRQDLDAFLGIDRMLTLALRCRDRIGDYGVVGIAVVDEAQEEPTLTDFCLSCRVAQKRVEHAFLQWLAESLRARGRSALRVTLVRTDRNGPLLQVFADLPFRSREEESPQSVLEMVFEDSPPLDDIIAIEVSEGALPESGGAV